jgi:hypothetical protein
MKKILRNADKLSGLIVTLLRSDSPVVLALGAGELTNEEISFSNRFSSTAFAHSLWWSSGSRKFRKRRSNFIRN